MRGEVETKGVGNLMESIGGEYILLRQVTILLHVLKEQFLNPG